MPRPRGVVLSIAVAVLVFASAVRAEEPDEPPWVRNRREAMDKAGGVPPAILARQSLEKVKVPTLDEAIGTAGDVARRQAHEILKNIGHPGRRIVVPDQIRSIQAAIDAAKAGDVVIVRAGTYRGLLVMKEGVRLVSDASSDGNERVAVKGARLKLPRRTLRTILDGTGAEPSRHGIIDFPPGTSRHTVVDGFTIQNLPKQNHHLPGHAHALNLRGASPVVMNCLIQDNGSTGIGNHVVYRDQDQPMPQRDFRLANVKHEARGLIFQNVVRRNLGRGIGCNHFSAPRICGNEVSDNDDAELGEPPGPGIGLKHGASPRIIGNLVHGNPGGGIMGRVGAPQGRHPIDRPPRPWIHDNVVEGNGESRPGIGLAGCGTKKEPAYVVRNVVIRPGAVGIGLTKGSVGVVVGNVVVTSPLQGIAIQGSTALELSGNGVVGAGLAGIAIVRHSRVRKMLGNAAHETQGPRFVLQDSAVEGP
jgi:hypothetical protein